MSEGEIGLCCVVRLSQGSGAYMGSHIGEERKVARAINNSFIAFISILRNYLFVSSIFLNQIA